jgi:hypothetical protein
MTTPAAANTAIVCALCRRERPLIDSHLIPSFVIRAFKDEAITRFLRRPTNPNVRYQDGVTEKLLCAHCDNVLLSAGEAAFAKDVLAPRRARTLTEFTCTEMHRYFAASLTWRIVVFKLREGEDALRADEHTDEDIAAMRDAEAALRPYLLGEAPYPERYAQHVFFAGLTAGDAPTGLDVYLNATIEMWIPGNGDKLYAISNLSFGILSFCRLRPPSLAPPHGGTLLEPGAVIRTSGQTISEQELAQILAARGPYMERYKTASPTQKEKISQAVAKADIAKWLRGWHGSAYAREHERATADKRVFVLVVRDDAGDPHKTELPYEALSAALADAVPEALERIEALEVSAGMQYVDEDEADHWFGVFRIA